MARTAAQKFSRPSSTRKASGESTDTPGPSSTKRKTSRRVVASGTRETVVKGRVVPTSGRIVQNCDACREGRNRCDRLDRCSECVRSRMRGRVCTYSAAGPSHAKVGSRPFQQNQEEIARLRKQVDILARVLRLSEDELEVLSIQAGGALSQSPPPTSRQSSPPAPSPPPRPQDIFDSMFSPGDPLIDLCRAAAVSHPIANAPPQPTPAAPPAPPPADLNIRAATGDTSVNSGLRPRS